MTLKPVNIDQPLMTPANFAKEYINRPNEQTARKYVYDLINHDKIDHTEIDGVIFIILNDRTLKTVEGF